MKKIKLSIRMDRVILISFLVAITISTFGQSKNNLHDELWNRSQSCYSLFEDSDGDGTFDDVEVLDDAQNGYLQVSGSFPTCGCYCEKTIAAFIDSKGGYTFLDQEDSYCSWLHKVSSNRDFTDVFPENFSIASFAPSLSNKSYKYSVFSLVVDIPQFGTDVEVSLKIIPIGLQVINDSLMVYNMDENKKNIHRQSLDRLPSIFLNISDEGLELISNNKTDSISKKDADVLKQYFSENQKELSFEGFETALKQLHEIYTMYSSVEHVSITLSWDKTNARFKITNKEKGVSPITFGAFLKDKDILQYWTPLC